MAIRNDITINWNVSPRIIEIAYPSEQISVQDLYDTLRYLGSMSEAIDKDEIIDASGKEVLAENLFVGLTVQLKNAKVKFEDRISPPVVLCNIDGGNLVAMNSEGYSMNPIEPSNNVTVTKTASSSATLQNFKEIENILVRAY